jgi:hypothetical protein
MTVIITSTGKLGAAVLATAIAFPVGIVYLLRAHHEQRRWAMDGGQ